MQQQHKRRPVTAITEERLREIVREEISATLDAITARLDEMLGAAPERPKLTLIEEADDAELRLQT